MTELDPFRVHPNMTILQLKLLVRERDGVPVHNCRLAVELTTESTANVHTPVTTSNHTGFLLDDYPLHHYSITDASQIVIVFDPNGVSLAPSPSNEQCFDMNSIPF